ncbi:MULTISPECIES: alpha/beta hydrolase family protein [unclassified Luteococcus]|uniref:alpha/beta hydrolase family protein n=1 Tax=unclassified Luteococcus TaxID=2639923 RepID=UPI00313CDA76
MPISYRRPATAAMAGLLALATATTSQAAPVPSPDPHPTPVGTAGTLPAGWRLSGSGPARELVRLPHGPRPVTDARPHVFLAGRDLGPARVARDGSLRIRLAQLPSDLSRLEVHYGAATEAELLARRGTRRMVQAQAAQGATASGTVTASYSARPLRIPGMAHPQAITGRVVAPAGKGTHPVVLLLHGRHDWCLTDDGQGWPCAAGKAVPNLEGYRYLQEALAQRGYFTVSIDANAINAQDDQLGDLGASARAATVRAHLDLLAGWRQGASAPFARTVTSRYDVQRTLLVGHSRGGEGVALAAIQDVAAGKHRVAGLVLLGPTNFFHTSASTTPTLTVLPGCDGDVSDLQGVDYADGATRYGTQHALSSVAYLPGANHNYFNTTWTPGSPTGVDDGQATACQPSARLSPAQQRATGVQLVTAFAERVLKSQGQATAVDGTGSAPAGVLPAGLVTSATGGARRRLVQPGQRGWKVTGATVCRGQDCVANPDSLEPAGVHWRSTAAVDPSGWVWKPATAITLRPARPITLRGSSALDLRVALSPSASLNPILKVTDGNGHSVLVKPQGPARRTGIHGGGDGVGGRWLAQNLRFPLPAKGLNPDRITAVSLQASGRASGSGIVLDLSAAHPGITPAAALPPSVLTLPAEQSVTEGASPWVKTITARLSRPTGSRTAALALVQGGPPQDPRWQRVPADARTIPLTLPIPGNTEWGLSYDLMGQLLVRGPVLVATPTTWLHVLDDDPMPRATVTRAAVSAKPGQTMRWTITLDRVSTLSDHSLTVSARPVSPALTVRELGQQSRQDWGVDPASTESLAQAGATNWVRIPAGRRTATITLGLGGKAVPGHTVALELSSDDLALPKGARLTGVVARP